MLRHTWAHTNTQGTESHRHTHTQTLTPGMHSQNHSQTQVRRDTADTQVTQTQEPTGTTTHAHTFTAHTHLVRSQSPALLPLNSTLTGTDTHTRAGFYVDAASPSRPRGERWRGAPAQAGGSPGVCAPPWTQAHSQTPAESAQIAGAPSAPGGWRDASLEEGGGGEPPH